eukprot:TRINITY_DN6301_c0_g1_i2.p1 TRINITY_DN6301_c0_g1~~TRINITY_DN6301_c0_g1_i2.p1  ORF type:complete len:320 (-),score=68.13 TRINITY_DN6301_c0_g1_i2:520-1479(-)
MASFVFSWPAIAASCLLCLYIVQIILRHWLHPLSTIFGINVVSRRRWALRILEKESRAILAVQTFRNSCYLMVIRNGHNAGLALTIHFVIQTLLASACVSIGLVTLKKAFNADAGSQTRVVLLALSAVIFASFFSLIRVMEALQDAGYLTLMSDDPLGPKPVQDEAVLVKMRSSSKLVQQQLQQDDPDNGAQEEGVRLFRSFNFESLEEQTDFHLKKVKVFIKTIDVITWYGFFAFRLLMYCIPFGFWLISSYWFLGVSALVVAFLLYMDRVERFAVFTDDDDEYSQHVSELVDLKVKHKLCSLFPVRKNTETRAYDDS